MLECQLHSHSHDQGLPSPAMIHSYGARLQEWSVLNQLSCCRVGTEVDWLSAVDEIWLPF